VRAWGGLIRPRLTSVALILGSLALARSEARAEEEVRIAILATQERIEIGGRALAVFDAESGDRLASWTDQGAATVSGANGRLRLTGKAANTGELGGARRILVEAKGGVRAGAGVYLGRIEIGPDERGKLIAINRLPLETYLLGIVGSEMSPEWPLEALEAQAVAARTYALQRRMMMRAANKPYDLESSVISQVYRGADKIRPSVIEAVKRTRGEVMSFRHGLAEALFHSTCGGKTSSALAAFGRAVPYLVSEPCRWCRDSVKRRWAFEVPIQELSSMLQTAKLTQGKLKSFERKDGATFVSVRERTGGKSVSPKAVRQAMGYGVLFSEHFTAQTNGSHVHIEGTGFGHGVGMCQWGARGLALEGKTHEEILQYYYRGVRIQRIY
jgi:stage II sporulation protein D (peptidoglycan lytic transglycosylase)